VGLLYALVALTPGIDFLSRIAVPAASLGMVFHFVSLSEAVLVSGQLTLASVHNSESLLAFLMMAVFMIVYLVYHTSSPGMVVFPLVFLLTFVAATGQQPFLLTSPGLRTGWLIAGSVVAQAQFGRVDFLDPKVFLSILMWAVYLVMVYTRWSAGWRGRRAAYLATGAFLAAVVAWAANYVSAIHRFASS